MARHTFHDTQTAERPRRQPERRWPDHAAGWDRTERLRLAVVRPVARRSLVPGTVVMAHVPFEEEPHTSKLRPAVVRSVEGRSVTVLPATSADSRWRYPHRHRELVDPAAAGLPRATAVRAAEVTLDVIDVVSVVGRLGDADHQALFGDHTHATAQGPAHHGVGPSTVMGADRPFGADGRGHVAPPAVARAA